MTPEAFIQQKAAAAIQAIYNTEVAPGSLQVAVTRKEFEGDYTLVTFPLLKITRQAPDATGNAIGLWLVANVPEIAAYNSVKGFLNLSFSPVYWNEALQGIAADDAFGQLPSTGKRIMVEFSSPNTNKPLHLGHIRNNLLGDSVSRILKACGNEVIKSTIVNDRGVHICKSMYAWEKCFNGATPESTGKKGDHLVGDCYVAYAKMEKEHPEVIDDVHKMLVDWEAGDPHVRELWAMMNGWVYEGPGRLRVVRPHGGRPGPQAGAPRGWHVRVHHPGPGNGRAPFRQFQAGLPRVCGGQRARLSFPGT